MQRAGHQYCLRATDFFSLLAYHVLFCTVSLCGGGYLCRGWTLFSKVKTKRVRTERLAVKSRRALNLTLQLCSLKFVSTGVPRHTHITASAFLFSGGISENRCPEVVCWECANYTFPAHWLNCLPQLMFTSSDKKPMGQAPDHVIAVRANPLWQREREATPPSSTKTHSKDRSEAAWRS